MTNAPEYVTLSLPIVQLYRAQDELCSTKLHIYSPSTTQDKGADPL